MQLFKRDYLIFRKTYWPITWMFTLGNDIRVHLWYLIFYCCRGILVDLVQARSSLGKLSQLVSGTELRWEDVDFVQWVFLGLSTSSAPPSFYLATSEVQDILLDRIQYLFMFLLFFFLPSSYVFHMFSCSIAMLCLRWYNEFLLVFKKMYVFFSSKRSL